MSCANHPTDTLARSPADVDPTRTKTLRRNYAQRLRGPLRKLNAAIREAVQREDLFGLNTDTLQPEPPQPPNDRTFRFGTDDEQIEAFMRWLRRQESRGILEVIHRDENTFIRSAYAAGVRHADAALNEQGVQIPERDLQAMFNTPVHQEALQTLYTRNFQELQGVTDAMNQQISRELADGFAQGWSPTKMARNTTDRVDAVGKYRATLLARTETIRAHSTSTLNRFEEFGTEQVTIQAEWSTAGDRRVCPICQTLEGRVMTIEEARTETFQFQASESQPSSLSGSYPIQPPAHPQCRCSLLPLVN